MIDLPWINLLPESWRAKPLRAVSSYMVSNVDKASIDNETAVRLCNYTDVYHNEFIALELDFLRATATDDEIDKFRLAVDDVLITKDSESWDDIGVPSLVTETADDLLCGYHLALLRSSGDQIIGRFLFRCLQAKPIRIQLELAASGVTRFGLPKSGIGGVMLPVPPTPQQRAIADYLDRETARLDNLIAEKQRILQLLAEKRQALITRAVTYGLDPEAPLRNTGAPWIGAIPAHWIVTRLKFVADVRTGLALGQKTSDFNSVEYPYLSVANVQDGHLDLSNVKMVRLPRREAESFVLCAGDVLMNEGGDDDKLGRGCVWRGEIAPCLHQNHVFAVRPRGVRSEWLNLWTSSEGTKSYFRSRAKKATNLASISAGNVRELPLAVPPVGEQDEIVAHVTAAGATLDRAHSATARTLALLDERRAALTAAVVTGRFEVKATS